MLYHDIETYICLTIKLQQQPFNGFMTKFNEDCEWSLRSPFGSNIYKCPSAKLNLEASGSGQIVVPQPGLHVTGKRCILLGKTNDGLIDCHSLQAIRCKEAT